MQLQHRTAPTAEVVGGRGRGAPRAFCARGQTEDRRLSELRGNDLKPSERRKEKPMEEDTPQRASGWVEEDEDEDDGGGN